MDGKKVEKLITKEFEETKYVGFDITETHLSEDIWDGDAS